MSQSGIAPIRLNARLVAGPPEARRAIPLDRFPFILGRGSACSLRLEDPRISREHALIDQDGDGYFLRDLGSRHGTFVNGLPLQAAASRLRTKDQITLGLHGEPFLFEAPEQDTSTRTFLLQLAQPSASSSELETLSLFLKAAQNLNNDSAVNDVLRTMLEYTLALTQAERGFVFLGDTAETFRLGYGQDNTGAELTGPDHQGTISRSIVRAAASSQLEFILGDAAAEAARSGNESLILQSLRSVAAIPLRGQHSGRLLGLLYLDSRSSSQNLTRTGQDILKVIARQAATLLENLSMLEAEREAALLRKELEIAASIQRQIIPQTLPQFPSVRISARSVPCTGVGGDFYDVIPVPGGFVAIVADVSGKGVPAALLASMVQGMVHAQISSGASLLETVRSINNFVCCRAPGDKYVTLAILRYTHTGPETAPAQIELINGGHVSPVVVRSGGSLEAVTDGDMPVGLLDFASFHAIAFTLAPGDRLVLLSDGISEAEDPAGIQFGAAELGRALLLRQDPVTTLFEAVNRFSEGAHPQDDQTVLTIECTS